VFQFTGFPLSVFGQARKMSKKNPNPLYKKLPGEDAAAHMKRLRLEFPKKFGRQFGATNNPAKKKAKQAKFDAAVDAAVEKAVAKLQTPPAPAPVTAPAPAIPAPQIPAPAPAVAPPPATAPLDIPMSNPTPSPAVPDTKIFGSETPPPPKVDPNADPVAPPLPPGVTPSGPGPAPAAEPPPDNLGLATIVWTMLVNLFVGIFGPTWRPTSAEENEMCVSAWRAYFESIGIKPFSPLVNLWMAMIAYSAPRFGSIVAKFRKKKKPLAESPRGGPPESTEGKEPSPEPPPAPEPKSTPPPPGPPAPVSAAPTFDLEDLE